MKRSREKGKENQKKKTKQTLIFISGFLGQILVFWCLSVRGTVWVSTLQEEGSHDRVSTNSSGILCIKAKQVILLCLTSLATLILQLVTEYEVSAYIAEHIICSIINIYNGLDFKGQERLTSTLLSLPCKIFLKTRKST